MLSRDELDALYAFAENLTELTDEEHLLISETIVGMSPHAGLGIELAESVAMLELASRAPFVLDTVDGSEARRAAEKLIKLYDEIEVDYHSAILDRSDSFVTVLGARLEWALHELKERMEG